MNTHDMRLLGIDFGLKRIGLAVSDPGGNLAFPLKTIVRTTRQAVFDELLKLITKEKIEAVVLGIPLGPGGEKNLTARQVRNFRESLERRIDLPVYMVNEAFTSCEADTIMSERCLTHDRKKQGQDQLAAVLILETFMNRREVQ
jgi:putative holliday junction resolvase